MFLLKRFSCEANSFKGSNGIRISDPNILIHSWLKGKETTGHKFPLHLKANLWGKKCLHNTANIKSVRVIIMLDCTSKEEG